MLPHRHRRHRFRAHDDALEPQKRQASGRMTSGVGTLAALAADE